MLYLVCKLSSLSRVMAMVICNVCHVQSRRMLHRRINRYTHTAISISNREISWCQMDIKKYLRTLFIHISTSRLESRVLINFGAVPLCSRTQTRAFNKKTLEIEFQFGEEEIWLLVRWCVWLAKKKESYRNTSEAAH